jgi:hypothetical protein
MSDRNEFITEWPVSSPTVWANRAEGELIGSSKGGHLLVPAFAPFDFIAEPNRRVLFLSAPSNCAFVDAPRGTEAMFHRNADFEELHFHQAGETVYETEYGIVSARAGELLLIPSGVACRVTGKDGALRLTMRTRDPLNIKVLPEDQIGHTEYDVEWVGAPQWPVTAALFPKGRVTESIHTWNDLPGEQTLIQRDYDRLVGSIKVGGPGPFSNSRGIYKIRLFDIFKEITGKRGPGPVSLENEFFFMECYNTVGEQFAFHRANRSEECQIQFCGAAENISEFGTDLMDSGMGYVQRRGISHRVKGSPAYRRMVFYSREPWKLHIDLSKPLRKTTFKVTERVLEAAPWRAEIAQHLATALKR